MNFLYSLFGHKPHSTQENPISDIRKNLDDSEGKITSKIKLIEQLLSKAEKIVQEST